jgi:two-component system phosphate regulon response regulator OmpR
MLKILVIDDDTRLRNLLAKFFNENGYEAIVAEDANQAREQIKIHKINLIISDIMMPNENGIEFAIKLKKESNIPLIMLSSIAESKKKIEAFEVGADDYVTKPFEPKELLLRVKRTLRMDAKDKEIYRFSDFIFDIKALQLSQNSEKLFLTDMEAKILTILCHNKQKPISREEIIKQYNIAKIDNRTVDVQINRLRKKIEKDTKRPEIIKTIRNSGYQINLN